MNKRIAATILGLLLVFTAGCEKRQTEAETPVHETAPPPAPEPEGAVSPDPPPPPPETPPVEEAKEERADGEMRREADKTGAPMATCDADCKGKCAKFPDSMQAACASAYAAGCWREPRPADADCRVPKVEPTQAPSRSGTPAPVASGSKKERKAEESGDGAALPVLFGD